MKWRLSESIAQKGPIVDKKPMSYAVNDKVDVIVNNDLSRAFKYEMNINNDITDRTIHNVGDHHHSHRQRLSIEQAFKVGNPKTHEANGEIFVITTNRNISGMPWTKPTSTTSSSPATTIGASSQHNMITNIITGGDSGCGIPTKNNNNENNLNGMILDNYSSETNNDFHYINSTTTNPSSTASLNRTNKTGSTAKLLPPVDDQSTKQTKYSIFRGLVLCLCLNVTYSNIVRFPRELERYGTAFLVPYFIVLFLVGLPIILLEVSIGQFLGQGAANTWRASPIFKGACVISRFASWLATIWISLDAVLAILYICTLIFRTIPFSECVTGVKIVETGYKQLGKSGQECLERTFLIPVWESTLYFALLTMSLIFLWIIAMACTHNAKIFRRTIFLFGLIGFGLLISLTGWEVHKSLKQQYFPEMWPFNETIFSNSNIWFNALVQVIFSTNIGLGILPVITGKFLYKGDALRTSVVYLSFNLLINAISVTLFIVQYDNEITKNSTILYPELKPHTAIYDNVLGENDIITTHVIPGLIYSLIVISSIISISVSIYTSSRLVPRHPNYILSIISLFVSVLAILCPNYIVSRVLDGRIVGTFVILALVFELIATTWIYGGKNIYTDLEFSIGRSIFKSWLILWCFAPVVLTGILLWWSVDDDQYDLIFMYIPRWGPLIFVLAIIIIIACIEISKQVDYNFFGMICEAAKPAKEWGPADPLARHAWKQWRSVCQDTGRKDFTLRRRGTRDYTHSIKRGQYSTANKYGTQNWKTSTPGNSSPNYSGSVFGDSAIEEDMSVGKYSGVNHQFTVIPSDNNIRSIRYPSTRSRKYSHEKRRNIEPRQQEMHKEILYIRRSSTDSNNATKIEITPVNDTTYSTRNPMARSTSINVQNSKFINTSPKESLPTFTNNDNICWRKFSVNSEEYSTEL